MWNVHLCIWRWPLVTSEKYISDNKIIEIPMDYKQSTIQSISNELMPDTVINDPPAFIWKHPMGYFLYMSLLTSNFRFSQTKHAIEIIFAYLWWYEFWLILYKVWKWSEHFYKVWPLMTSQGRAQHFWLWVHRKSFLGHPKDKKKLDLVGFWGGCTLCKSHMPD